MMIATGASISPSRAATAPGAPRNRAPTATETLMMLPPGRNWHRPRISANSAAVNQRRSSTINRRAQGRTPPKPRTPTMKKPVKSPATVGGVSAIRGALTRLDTDQRGLFHHGVEGGDPGYRLAHGAFRRLMRHQYHWYRLSW